MTLKKGIFIIVFAGSLLFLQQCNKPAFSTCRTSEDDEKIALVDSLEANIATLGVDSLERLINKLATNAQATPIALGYAQYRRGVQDHFSGNRAGAIGWYEKALVNYKKCPDVEPERVAMLYKNLAGKYFEHELQYRLGYLRATEGIAYLETLAAEDVPSDLYFELFLMAGRNKIRLGDAQLAITYFDLARNKLPFDSVSYYLQSQMADEKAMAYWSLNELDSAAYYNRQAEDIILQQPSLVFWDTLDLANVYNNACIIYDVQQRDSLAFLSLQKSIVFNRKLGDTLRLAGNLNNLGVFYKNRNQCKEGRTFFLEAQQLYQALGYSYGIAQIEDNIGDCYQGAGQLNEALKKYNTAIGLFYGGKEENKSGSVTDAKYRTGLYEPLVSRARVLVKLQGVSRLNTDAELWHAYAQIDSLLQAIRLDFTDEKSKIYTQARIKPVYEELIALCYRGWETSADITWAERAVTYFERSKNLVLEEAIVQDHALERVLSREHYEKERELAQLASYLYQQSLNGHLTASEQKQFQNRQLQTELQLRQLRDTLRQQYPQYQSFQSLAEGPRLADLKKRLSGEEQLLNFFVGREATYCLSITSEEVVFTRLEKRKGEVTEAVQAFRKALEAPLSPGRVSAIENDQAIRNKGYGLYNSLLAEALNNSKAKRLIILPDDILAYLPFEALLTSPVTTAQSEMYHQYPFLIKEYTINYQFSLGLWWAHQQEEPSAKKAGLLVVAPAQGEKYHVKLTDQTDVVLPSLGYSQEEIKSVNTLGRVKVLAGPKATKTAFVQAAPNYGVVHFTGHGNADPKEAYRSFLAFNLEESATQNDELIFLPELYTLNIPAEMLVLSACQTADGRLSVGEGVLSLTRGATLAGAKSVVSSLWLVNQQSKVGLIELFYQQLASGEAKDAALRSAKLNYLQRADSPWSHPYHWAGMVLVGNPRPLKDLL